MTNFEKWMTDQGFTIAEAAKALGISESSVSNYRAGVNRSRGNEYKPDYAIRVVMALLHGADRDEALKNPWPA